MERACVKAGKGESKDLVGWCRTGKSTGCGCWNSIPEMATRDQIKQ